MLPMEKTTPKRSLYGATYPDYSAEARDLRSTSDTQRLDAFDAIDKGGEGMLLPAELRMFLQLLLGIDPTERQLRTLEAYVARMPGAVVRDSVVITGRFREQQDASRRAGVISSGASGAAPLTGFHVRGPQPHSSYQTDVGTGSDLPSTRPVADPVGAGYYSTTRDLALGTSRQSKHAPGYMGHIPAFLGTHAASQGLGATKRDTFHAKTNLGDTFATRVPGYGGHVPRFSTSDAPEIRVATGQFAPTNSSAADHVIKAYWATTNAARK